ncbi:MAG: SigE family RNA polymerase sigma factor [Ornithinimicrobium sp.]
MSNEHDEEFVRFVADHSSRLLTAAWMLTGDPHAAEELVHEAMERVYLKWGRVPQGQPKAYARKILVNLHTDRWRSPGTEMVTDEVPADAVSADAVPKRLGNRESRHVDLIRALQSLPAREREVVVLRHYLDQSERATADALGIGVGAVKAAGSRGLSGLGSLTDREEPHTTSDEDVLDLVNRAAMDPPAMHLRAQSVLASARARRSRQRRARGAMAVAAVAAVAVAATVWVGLGPGFGNVLGDDVGPTTPLEWDESVAFETALTTGDGTLWPEFGDALVRRPAGADDFSVVLRRDGADTTLAGVVGDLPDGVDLFEYKGHSLIVSEERYDAPSALDVSSQRALAGVPGVELGDGRAVVHVWVVDRVLQPAQISDIYWQLPEDVQASSGDPVRSEVIDGAGSPVSIFIVESTGRWGIRPFEARVGLRSAGVPDDAVSDGDVVYAVLPGDARLPELVVSGEAYDAQNQLSQTTLRLEPTVRISGQYQLAWAPIEDADFISGGHAVADWDGAPPSFNDPQEVSASETPEGDLEVSYGGTDSRLRLQPGQTTTGAVIGDDGSALAIAPWPIGLGGEDDPPGVRGLGAALVLDLQGQLITNRDILPRDNLSSVVPGAPEFAATWLPPGPVSSQGAHIVPTVLFATDAGPRWAGQPAPRTYALADDRQIALSIDPDLLVWAAQCGDAPVAVGGIGSAEVDYLDCADPGTGEPDVGERAVLVLRTEVAQRALPLLNPPGSGPDRAVVSEPDIIDIGDGLSIWTVTLGPPAAGGGDSLSDLLSGVDLDGDGAAETASP